MPFTNQTRKTNTKFTYNVYTLFIVMSSNIYIVKTNLTVAWAPLLLSIVLSVNHPVASFKGQEFR